MTLLELLLVGIGVLLALIALGLRFAVRELREIRLYFAHVKTTGSNHKPDA